MSAFGSNGFVCYRCNAPVDSVRAAVRIIESRVLRVCTSCCSGLASTPPTQEPYQASVIESDAVKQVVEEEFLGEARYQKKSELPSHPRRFHWKSGARAVAALIVSVPVFAMAFANEASIHGITPPEFGNDRKLLSLESSPIEIVETEASALVSASSWVHPIVGSEEKVPIKGTRLFGAERPGNRPVECRGGHCGVDLDGPRGAPVVAVRPGVIEKVVDDENASGGRYVWIRHDDLGLQTEYFHFDSVAPGLKAGESVVAGQWLGTLGRSGIEHSEPHLHFALLDLKDGNRYIDPQPFLEPATIVGLLDLRLGSGP